MLERGCSLLKARLRLEAAKPAYRCCSQFSEPCRRLVVGSKHNPCMGRPGSGGWPLCAASVSDAVGAVLHDPSATRLTGSRCKPELPPTALATRAALCRCPSVSLSGCPRFRLASVEDRSPQGA